MKFKNNTKTFINGKIAFATQKPWIANLTLKENVLFGQEYDEIKYKDCIKYACLEKDIELLQQGDETVIGEKGVNLSGGQKARVNLARAIYSGADILLLDDILR